MQPAASAAEAHPDLSPLASRQDDEGSPWGGRRQERADDPRADASPGATRSTPLPEVATADAAGFGFGANAQFFPSLEPRELILSFDDGPDLKYTPMVLDELDRWGIKAIFFVTGHRLTGERPEDLARRELVRKIAARGHLVSNHTFSHRDLCQAPDDALAAEIDGNEEVIAETTGVRPLLFRGPYGARCKRLEAALAARGLISVGWNLDPQDWKTSDPDAVLSYLESRLEHLEGRGILLLHDTHASSVFALAPLLEWIARENRAAIENGRPSIVLQSYAVLLPRRDIPPTGIETVVAAVARRTPRLAGLFPSFLARR